MEMHANSPRRDKRFVGINCAAIPETLFEAILFGAEKGSHSLAYQRQIGLLEEAGAGTVFLDEIGDLPLPLQAKLLRAIQTLAFRRLAGEVDVPLRATIYSATHRDLWAMAQAGTFRRDLYFRLVVHVVTLLGLSERKDEIVPTARRMLAERGRSQFSFRPDAENALVAYEWPGGFRQMKSVVARLVETNITTHITEDDIKRAIDPESRQNAHASSAWVAASAPRSGIRHASRTAAPNPDPPEAIDSLAWHGARPHERAIWRTVCEVFDATQTKSAAARHLGVTRNMLERWLNDMGHPRRSKV